MRSRGDKALWFRFLGYLLSEISYKWRKTHSLKQTLYVINRTRWNRYQSRLFLDEYESNNPQRPVDVYFHPGVWQERTEDHRQVNRDRFHIIQALQSSLGAKFLGGFANNMTALELYPEATYSQSISHEAYVRNMQQSQIVISTNGVDGCHSWRTGEAFASGAIVVTQRPVNYVDEYYQHGENVFFYKTAEECIKVCLNLLAKTELERQELRDNSWKYYTKHLRPGNSRLMTILQTN